MWSARGCEIAVADNDDPSALAQAFAGLEGAFVMFPPSSTRDPAFRKRRSDRGFACVAPPGRTIGAAAPQPSLLNQFGLLRAAWFLEKAAADVVARKTDVVPSYLKPLEKQFRMANPVVSRSSSEASQYGDPSLGPV
jgi:NAD(P)H dehydrogenase (quinone)